MTLPKTCVSRPLWCASPVPSLVPLLCPASIQDRVASGLDAGRPLSSLRESAVDLGPSSQGLPSPDGLVAESQGFSLYAVTRVVGADSDRLEALIH